MVVQPLHSPFKWELNVVNIVKQAQQWLYFFKKVKIVWFDHTGHAQLLQSCNRECFDMVYHSMVWVDYTEGNAQIKQSCENCFPNHRQRPSLPSLEILYQQRLLGRATLISQDSSHPAHDLFEPLHLVADSGPSKPGPTTLVLAFSP